MPTRGPKSSCREPLDGIGQAQVLRVVERSRNSGSMSAVSGCTAGIDARGDDQLPVAEIESAFLPADAVVEGFNSKRKSQVQGHGSA